MVSEPPDPQAMAAEHGQRLNVCGDEGSSSSPIMMGTLNDENGSMLTLHFEDVIEAITQFYNLASQIRNPRTRKYRTDIDLYKDVDDEIKSEYVRMRKKAELQGIEQILLQSLSGLMKSQNEERHETLKETDECLIQRLQKANHARRQQFEYWRRSKKRSIRAASKAMKPMRIGINDKYDELKHDTPSLVQPSEVTRSLLSSVPALPKDFVLEHKRSTYTGTSRGVTVHGPSGEKVNWPKPPVASARGGDFECPFCFYLCGPKYSGDATWRFVLYIYSNQFETEDPELDHISSMTFDPMFVPTVSARIQMCYTTAGKIGHAMSNGRIKEEYGDVRSTLRMNMSSLLLMRIM